MKRKAIMYGKFALLVAGTVIIVMPIAIAIDARLTNGAITGTIANLVGKLSGSIAGKTMATETAFIAPDITTVEDLRS